MYMYVGSMYHSNSHCKHCRVPVMWFLQPGGSLQPDGSTCASHMRQVFQGQNFGVPGQKVTFQPFKFSA